MQSLLQFMQKFSAAIMIPLIVGHIGLTLYARQAGLSATQILDRIEGHVGWITFYSLLVVAVAIHGPIGVRNIINSWTRWRGLSLDLAVSLLSGVLLFLGLTAVGTMTIA